MSPAFRKIIQFFHQGFSFNLFYIDAFKINRIFVLIKIILSMALLSFKWLLVSLLSFGFIQQEHKEAPLPVTSEFHPFYVSVTEISHNAKDKTLEVSCKIFADDMEDILKKIYGTKVDLSNTQHQDQNNKLITDYISKHLVFVADGKPQKLSYIGYEKESEAVYCYFEVSNLATLKKLDITNSLLQDFNNTQINIMHVVVNGNRKSYKLDFPNKQASFTF